jgi:hypothetical protein
MVSSVRSDNGGVATFYYVNKGSNYSAVAFDLKAGLTRKSQSFNVSESVNNVTINDFQE